MDRIGSAAFVISSMGGKRQPIWDANKADHRHAFAKALAPLVLTLWKRKDDFGNADVRVYMRTLRFVPSPILIAACERALETLEWFPEPAKLLALTTTITEERRKVACEKWLTDCDDCHGSRWQTVVMGGVSREQRCGCWKRAMQAMNEIHQPGEHKALGGDV